MQIGRVKIGNKEKWVGFIGGGYNRSACATSDDCNTQSPVSPAGSSAGKGFFVVDLTNGSILKAFTHANNGNMNFSAPASPAPYDLDSDGFIDTVYMGDLGGNMWRFRLCPRIAESCNSDSYDDSCDTGDWTASLLYSTSYDERGGSASNERKQIFTKATAAKDTAGNVWVYFGTGENQDPTRRPASGFTDSDDTKNRLYAIKEDRDGGASGENGVDGDPKFTHTYTTSDLKNITSTSARYCAVIGTNCTADNVKADTETVSTAKNGWYINLSSSDLSVNATTSITSLGEKMISDPVVFGGVVYFATYVPDQGVASACGKAGNAFLYGLNYVSGAGALGTSSSPSRTDWIGLGIGSTPLVSYRPDNSAVDIYATASGGAGSGALTQELGEAPKTSSMTNILYWKDKRLE
jgi:type IV pilus assembly protein PilY1